MVFQRANSGSGFFVGGKMDVFFFGGGNLFFLGTFRNCFGGNRFFLGGNRVFFLFSEGQLCCKEDILDMTQLLVS